MYGTVAHTRVKPENRDALQEVLRRQEHEVVAPGFVAAYVLFEDEGDAAWLFAVFEDKAAYAKNADDPAQHERYTQYRALMEDEPQWHDGAIASG